MSKTISWMVNSEHKTIEVQVLEQIFLKPTQAKGSSQWCNHKLKGKWRHLFRVMALLRLVKERARIISLRKKITTGRIGWTSYYTKRKTGWKKRKQTDPKSQSSRSSLMLWSWETNICKMWLTDSVSMTNKNLSSQPVLHKIRKKRISKWTPTLKSNRNINLTNMSHLKRKFKQEWAYIEGTVNLH